MVAGSPQPTGRWSWDGGTAVTVAAGDTIETIARRHGVPAPAIMQANSLASNAIQPGQRLVIPRYIPAAPPSAPSTPLAPPAVASTPARSPASTSTNAHVVAAGDTLYKLSRQYGRSVPDIARANNIETHATLKIGDRLVIPGVRTAARMLPKRVSKGGQPLASQTPKAAPPAKQPEPTQQQASVMSHSSEAPQAEASDGPTSFRWPVKGRVIAGFGPKPNGQQNDGINIAVPEGTPFKAAEDGVVAYAGNELKGYGNLVLIRHPNGYVTAYAHAKELMVKRGDPIKRGQVIGKSGQTGNVDAPQLHFEIRKGPTPLDPIPRLARG
jgi:murein DD-endopeptidase MepM/ murein hydrolase activator NlpD